MSNYHELAEISARLTRIETRMVKLMIHMGMEAPGLPTRRPIDIPRDYANPTNANVMHIKPSSSVLSKLRDALGK
jgi:hypothetical protein